MKDFLGIVGFGVLIAVLILISPAIFLWSLNTIGDHLDGFYVPHTPWTYLASYGIMLILRGGK